MGKAKTPMHTAMRRIVVEQVTARKCRQAIRKVVDTIYDQPISKRAGIFREVTELLATLFYKQGHEKKKEEIRELGAAIAERGLSENDITFFRQAHDASDGFSDDPYRLACNRLGVAYFRYFGRNLDTTKEFCRVFFREHARDFQQASEREKPEAIYLTNYARGRMYYLAHDAASVPPLTQHPQKLWFNNLVRGVADGDPEAKMYLRGVIALVFFNNPKDYTLTTLSRLSEWVGENNDRREQYWNQCADPNCPIVVVEDDMEEPFKKFFNDLVDEGERLQQRCQHLEQWFLAHQRELSAVFDRRCAEIMEKPKHLLRPFGYDSIMISVSSLNAVGILSVSFHPENERFPDCKMAVHKKGAGEVFIQVWGMMRDFNLIARNQLLTGITQITNTEYLTALFEFIVVDALHQIIVGRSRKDLEKGKVERGKYRVSAEPRREVVVRPFIRRLPDGYTASDEARQHAFLHLGADLPDGFTFVRSHERWVGLPEGKPAPLFRFTDQSIMKSIEED